MTRRGEFQIWSAFAFLGLATALTLIPTISAQMTLSTIRGTVTDQTGAFVPKVDVAVTDIQTNLKRSTISNEQGNFEIPDLKPGTYRLEGRAQGFKTFVADNVILESSQIRRIEVALQVGETTTEVSVSASAAVIAEDEAKISSSFQAKAFEESPFSGIDRFNPTAMLYTKPGITPGIGGGHNFTIGGLGYGQIEEGMDGAVTQGTVNQVHNMEDAEEVKIVTVNNSAEFSRAGYFNLVGKRGYNALHGDTYFQNWNSAPSARQFFDPKKVQANVSIFGASASGRIIKDKTFFYASYNGVHDSSKQYFLIDTPTSKMRTGDFSDLLNLAKPITIKDPLTGNPFPGNVIPANRLNALPLKAQEKYIPAPNQGASSQLTQNLFVFAPYPADLYRVDYVQARIDHHFSEKDELFGRILNRWTPYVLAGQVWPGLNWTRNRYAFQQIYSETHIFSPTLVHTARFGWYLNRIQDGDTNRGYTPVRGDQVVKDLGLQGVNPKGISVMGFPTMSVTGYVPIQTAVQGGRAQDDDDYSWASATTWSRSRHTLKFGGEFRRYKIFRGNVPAGTFGSFAFNGSLSGYGWADFLLGLPFSSTRIDPLLNRSAHTNELGLYIDDTFKVSSRLTLNVGIRWDYFGAATWDDSLQYNWDPKTANVIVPQQALSRVSPLYPKTINVVAGQVAPNTDLRNFAPRLGVVYRLAKNTVVRGGYGVFTECALCDFGGLTSGQNFAFLNAPAPFQLSETFFNSVSSGQPLFQFPNPFPPGSGMVPSQSVIGYPLDRRNGYIQQFSATVEHEVGGVGLRASYIGQSTRNYNFYAELNKPRPGLIPFTANLRPYPLFVSTAFDRRDGAINYDGITLEALRKIGGITLDAHWTWAHSMANFLNLENPYGPLLWNRQAAIPIHRAVINARWEIPVGRARRYLSHTPSVVNAVLGGWVLNGISTLMSGQFFSPSFSGADPSNTNSFGGLPDRICNGNFPSGQRSINKWFDPSCFATPPAGRFGNSGVNVLEGPGLNVQHLTVSKIFDITERFKFTFAMASTNILNHANFAFPAPNVTLPSAGLISSTYGIFGNDRGAARRVEFRGRISW